MHLTEVLPTPKGAERTLSPQVLASLQSSHIALPVFSKLSLSYLPVTCIASAVPRLVRNPPSQNWQQ